MAMNSHEFSNQICDQWQQGAVGYCDAGANDLHFMRLIKVDKVHKPKVKMASL